MNDIEIDLTAARAALAALKPRLADIEPDRIRGVRLRDLCLGLVGFVAAIQRDDRLARLQALDGVDGWSVACVADLDTAAKGLWTVLTDLRVDRVVPAPTLDPALEDRAVKLRAEMHRVIGFYAHGDAKVEAELADIRSGTGFEDLSLDLDRLATLYAALDVPADATGYAADTPARARADSGAIAASIAAQRAPDINALKDTSVRLQGFIKQQWSDLVSAGRFMYRTESPKAHFPSLKQLAAR